MAQRFRRALSVERLKHDFAGRRQHDDLRSARDERDTIHVVAAHDLPRCGAIDLPDHDGAVEPHGDEAVVGTEYGPIAVLAQFGDR